MLRQIGFGKNIERKVAVFDLGEVREEFAQIASWGLRLVRICLLWEDFQPEPDRVESSALVNLTRVLDVAHGHGLQVMVTLFVGNMSGAMWFPRWAFGAPDQGIQRMQICAGQQMSRTIRDLYADPAMLRAEAAKEDRVTTFQRSARAMLATRPEC